MKRYAKDHEWICTDSEGIASIGISEFALRDFGEVNFVELPEIGAEFGEFLVSSVAQSTLEENYQHTKFPLAEIWKEKAKGNPGFDFHTI